MTDFVRLLASRQLTDYRSGNPGTFFADPERPQLSLDEAYRVQDEVGGCVRQRSGWSASRWAAPVRAPARSSGWTDRSGGSFMKGSYTLRQ